MNNKRTYEINAAISLFVSILSYPFICTTRMFLHLGSTSNLSKAHQTRSIGISSPSGTKFCHMKLESLGQPTVKISRSWLATF